MNRWHEPTEATTNYLFRAATTNTCDYVLEGKRRWHGSTDVVHISSSLSLYRVCRISCARFCLSRTLHAMVAPACSLCFSPDSEIWQRRSGCYPEKHTVAKLQLIVFIVAWQTVLLSLFHHFTPGPCFIPIHVMCYSNFLRAPRPMWVYKQIKELRVLRLIKINEKKEEADGMKEQSVCF